jgi:thioredoxin 2
MLKASDNPSLPEKVSMSETVQASAQTVQLVCPHCDATNRLPAGRDARAAKCGRCKSALFTGHPVALTTERFRKHLASSDVPLIVDFWAGWCGPCRAMAPVFDKAAEALEPRARFIKIDVDAEPALAQQFGMRGIPALFLFKDGKVAEHHAGLADIHLLDRWSRS